MVSSERSRSDLSESTLIRIKKYYFSDKNPFLGEKTRFFRIFCSLLFPNYFQSIAICVFQWLYRKDLTKIYQKPCWFSWKTYFGPCGNEFLCENVGFMLAFFGSFPIPVIGSFPITENKHLLAPCEEGRGKFHHALHALEKPVTGHGLQTEGPVISARPVFVQRLFVQGVFVQSISSNTIRLGYIRLGLVTLG